MPPTSSRLLPLISSLSDFTTVFGRVQLRSYQVEAAEAVLRSVLDNDGDTFVWKFARQSGKDETLAALYQYIMTIYAHRDASIVSAAPTLTPQSELSMQRLEARLSGHLALRQQWKRRSRYIFLLRQARTLFLSANSHANVVGATVWPLLILNEAQDIQPAVYDKRFAPMAAANNATRLFSGTAWTHDTLLAREERLCRHKEEQDGRRRVFIVDGPQVAKAHPPYGKFLESETARLGPNHPILVSQYLCREIDSQIGMFTPARRALMQSDRPSDSSSLNVEDIVPVLSSGYPASSRAESRQPIAFLIDVAGQDESSSLSSPLDSTPSIRDSRDSTTLSIVEIDLSSLELLRAPTYRLVQRHAWTGQNHLTVFGQLKALAGSWRPQHIVIDATRVGEGLWALLDKTFPTRVIPVKFTASLKSEIGYRFLAIIETGRFRDCWASDAAQSSGSQANIAQGSQAPTRAVVDQQYAACISEVLIGPQKTLRWGVPDDTRDADGELIHDDFVLADSLTAILDRLQWSISSRTLIIPAKDPLDEMSKFHE